MPQVIFTNNQLLNENSMPQLLIILIHASSSFRQVLCKPTSLEEMHTDLEMRTESG